MRRILKFLLLPTTIYHLVACAPADSGAPTAASPLERKADSTAPTPASQVERKAAVQNALAQLAGKKIFFAHQSVGANLVEGIGDLLSDPGGRPLNIAQTSDPAAFSRPLFAHDKVGQNSRPGSKLDDFERRLNAGIGERADVALLKFCYVDITARTEVEALFRQYEETMARLTKQYPQLRIVHVTVPLTTVPKGAVAAVKGVVKKMMGRGESSAYQDNVQRNRFNALLLQKYQGKEPVFDLAAIEATGPDGRAETFSSGGKIYLAMYPPYSNDGGHLTKLGRAKGAEGLLLAVAGEGR